MKIHPLRTYLLFFSLSFFIPLRILAQVVEGPPLSKLVAPQTPEYCTDPNGKVLGKSAKRSLTYNGGVWMVFSDRDDNKVYYDKSLTKPKGTVDFMQQFYVAEETDNSVRLVEYDPVNSITVELNKKNQIGFKDKLAQDAGWISKKNLLLWYTCLRDSSTNYSKKAIAVKKIPKDATSLKGQIRKGKGVLDLYDHPSADPKYDNEQDVNIFRYLFVFKEENGMLLLGKINRSRPASITSDILGWAPVTQLQVWNSAICLRINLEPEAIEERKTTNVDVRFFSDVEKAKQFKDLSKGSKAPLSLPFVYYDPTKNEKEKENPYFYGFPILNSDLAKEKIYKTGYVTNTVDENGNSVFSAARQADFNKQFEDIKQSKDNINIAFVLDGSQRAYFDKLAKAILNSTVMDANVTRQDFKLSAIVYNDLSDSPEERIVKIGPYSNKTSFADRLKQEAEKSVSINRDAGAPVYEAMLKACGLFDSKQTNLIVMLGTSGNPDKTDKTKVKDALKGKGVNMTFFQVNNKGGKAYTNYFRDCKEFLIETARALDNAFAADSKNNTRKPAELVSRGEDAFVLENTPIPGSFYAREENQSFTPDEIQKKIKSHISKTSARIDQLLAMFQKNTVGSASKAQDKYDESDRKEFRRYLKEGSNISDEDLDEMTDGSNYQLFIEAYVALAPRQLVNPHFKRVLFMHYLEYQRLKNTIETLYEASTASQRKTAIVDAYKSMIMTYKGGNEDPKKLENYTPDQIFSLTVGLPTNNPLFNRTLKDLKNDNVTSDDDLDQMRASFLKILEKIKNLPKNNSAKFEQDDEIFYWVSEDELHINS